MLDSAPRTNAVTFGKRVPAVPPPKRANPSPAPEAARPPAMPEASPALPVIHYNEPPNGMAAMASGDEESLLKAFIGPTAYRYLGVYERMKWRGGSLVWSWSWTAFFAPLPWCLYRKQWSLAAMVVAVPAVAAYVLGGERSIATGLTVVFAVLAKSVYVSNALKRVKQIAAMENDPARLVERVSRAGGVSVGAAIVGSFVMAAALVVGLLAIVAESPSSRAHSGAQSTVPAQTAKAAA